MLVAGSLTAFGFGMLLQLSIRSRGSDQSVVRGWGAQSRRRPSLGGKARYRSESPGCAVNGRLVESHVRLAPHEVRS